MRVRSLFVRVRSFGKTTKVSVTDRVRATLECTRRPGPEESAVSSTGGTFSGPSPPLGHGVVGLLLTGQYLLRTPVIHVKHLQDGLTLERQMSSLELLCSKLKRRKTLSTKTMEWDRRTLVEGLLEGRDLRPESNETPLEF